MPRLKSVKILFLSAFLFSTSLFAAADPIFLPEGKMTVGGTFVVSNLTNFPFKANFQFQTGFDFGYFIIDRLAFFGRVGLQYSMQTGLYSLAGAVSFGPTYYFDIGSIVSPYVGFSAVVGNTSSNNSSGGSSISTPDVNTRIFQVGGRPTAGILIALTRQIAFDIGIDTTISYMFGTPGQLIWNGNAGVLGVRGFF